MEKGLVILGAALIMVLAGAPARADELCPEPVATNSGLVRGMDHPLSPTCAWQGIPYAAPPVGDKRFRSPEPPAPWDGVRDAVVMGDKCMQRGNIGANEIKENDLAGMSEDCLYLNVYRPRKSGTFPVMVWIHGGGYVAGTGNTYRGDKLAAFGDVVVVTINYRLGLFGFLADPQLRGEDSLGRTGGQGSLDQVMALQWVHDNIANFGGDPNQVTIFGESAGGWAVCTMVASPLARGMFQRAIMESQGCSAAESLERGYDKARAIAVRVGCAPDNLSCLRQMPAIDLVNQGMGNPIEEGFTFMPREDGILLDRTPLEQIRAGDFNRVPLLAGHTRDEFDVLLLLRPRLYWAAPWQYDYLAQRALGLTPKEAERLTRLYPLTGPIPRPKNSFEKILSDATIICPTYTGLEAVALQGEPVYYYRFDYDDMVFGHWIGAAHSMELPFVFDSLEEEGYSGLYNSRNRPEAQALAKVIMAYWTNFAKTADPNGPGLAPWPPFDPAAPRVQVLDVAVRTETPDLDGRCEFWDRFDQTHPHFFETLGEADKR